MLDVVLASQETLTACITLAYLLAYWYCISLLYKVNQGLKSDYECVNVNLLQWILKLISHCCLPEVFIQKDRGFAKNEGQKYRNPDVQSL